MRNNTILGVPVHPSFRNPSQGHSGQNPKDLLQNSLLISSSNTWVRDSHFCTTYLARGVRTTGQMLEALWLCVRSQKMLCRNLTTIISSLSVYTEICRWYRMLVNLLLLHKILEAAVFATHHCYVYPTSGVNYIIFQLQNQSISHSQISLHLAACALPWHLKKTLPCTLLEASEASWQP